MEKDYQQLQKNKVVMGFSGGVDSTTLLHKLLLLNYEVHACFFIYGSKHNKYEKEAVDTLMNYYEKYDVVYHVFNVMDVFFNIATNSALISREKVIPEGHYLDGVMKHTIVPGRNLIFASIMSGLGETINAQYIALGTHSGDHAIYPDCRPDFNAALQSVILKSTEGKILLFTPFANHTKGDIIKWGLSMEVPYELTRTCYKDQNKACGVCAACVERKEAFGINNVKDPAV